jgi:hypothetical protein
MRFLSLRAIFLLGFVVAMPVLALPPVARRVDELLYGPPPTDFGRPPSAGPGAADAPPLVAGALAPASFEETSPAALPPPRGLDGLASPPLLPPTPAFAPPQQAEGTEPLTASGLAPEPKIDEQTIARLQQIRQRLEQLGAEYVMVETLDGSGRFRFHCRMLIDERSRFTRTFEATSFDPIAAGQHVLGEIERWRGK